MKVINVYEMQKGLYTFSQAVGEEFTVVNTKTHKIVFTFKVIPSPLEAEFKIEKDTILCTL